MPSSAPPSATLDEVPSPIDKRHAASLHARAKALLVPGCSNLICDHFVGEGGMTHAQLYMTIEAQAQSLLDAGFDTVDRLLVRGSLVLHRAS